MPDKVTPKKRSEIMSKVKSKNTSIEISFRKELWRKGYRYRIHSKLPGTPDIILPRFNVVIFIDGCFWHKCPICNRSRSSSNSEYWRDKIDKNVNRAINVDKELMLLGWNVVHIWEHQIKKDLQGTAETMIKNFLKESNSNGHT